VASFWHPHSICKLVGIAIGACIRWHAQVTGVNFRENAFPLCARDVEETNPRGFGPGRVLHSSEISQRFDREQRLFTLDDAADAFHGPAMEAGDRWYEGIFGDLRIHGNSHVDTMTRIHDDTMTRQHAASKFGRTASRTRYQRLSRTW
jgi:hypothetical protein